MPVNTAALLICIDQAVSCDLQACTGSGGGYAARFLCSLLESPALAYLWEHRVRGRALLPGAAMFEAAYAAGAALLGAHAATGRNYDPTVYVDDAEVSHGEGLPQPRIVLIPATFCATSMIPVY